MDLNLTVKQSQTLSPQMVQSMKVLQMGSQELLEYVGEVIQENPVLEAEQPPAAHGEEELTTLRKKLEWLDSTDRHDRYYQAQDSEQEQDPLVNYGGVSDQENDLYHHLLFQLQAMTLAKPLLEAAKAIVESLNGNGYLDEPLTELAHDLGIPTDYMQRALEIVQGLEPAGIGARDLSECLCLQLKRQEDTDLAQKIALDYLDALAKNRYNLIAKELSATAEQVREACGQIRALNPKPGVGFAGREQVSYVTPDLFVTEFPDHLELTTNDTFFPSLKISSYYRSLMGETQDEEVKEYLADKVRQAKWVVKSVEQRRSTLLSCAECILESQEEFFRKGRGCLVPLGLIDVADKLGIHESTVSRAIKGKYIQCGHGVYPLSYFFTRSLGGRTEENGGTTADSVKTLLKKLVAEENKKKPLSDQKLCELLAEQGCEISRRTVAKYRDELGIPSTTGRKEY